MFTETKTEQVERIERLDRDTFYKNYVLPNKPVVISQAISEWKAISSWSVDYFKSIAGETNIRVEVSPSRIFPPVHAQSYRQAGYHIEGMTFGQYIDKITSENSLTEGYYFAQQPVDVLFPQLMKDIRPPDYFKHKSLISTNIWFAGEGNITPMHYDLVHNLFAQVIGRKRFILFAPEQMGLLYPFPKTSTIANFSQVNLDDPDPVKFPHFQQARPLECIVEPGDILFLPIFWWHQVYALNLSVSISFWSHPGWAKHLNPAAMRLHFSSVAFLMRWLKSRIKPKNKALH